MKIFNAEQIRAWDSETIAEISKSSEFSKISDDPRAASVELMNRASATLSDWFSTIYKEPNQAVTIVCGTGNNGGDGLAVARFLHQRFFAVKVLVCDFSQKRSPDFEAQLEMLPDFRGVNLTFLKNAENLPQLAENEVVIDAIFGTGLRREPSGDFQKTIEWLNGLPNEIVSIDLPSGLFADQPTPGICVRADRTFTFETPKLAFFFPENAENVGEWVFGSIGLTSVFAEKTETPFHFLTKNEAVKLRRPRKKFDHKGSFGHALLVCGSFGKIGAAVLAARASLRSGVGLLTVHVPRCGYDIFQISVPEAICSIDSMLEFWTATPDISKFHAIGVGPGIGTAQQTERALEYLLKIAEKPLVLDADALNLLAKNPDWWGFLPKNSILTPHPKEFERLFGISKNDFARNNLQRKMAQQHGVFIVLKGAFSAIACPDGSCYFNSTGNPGMATGGSGDVLTGILTGLLAQGHPPKSAALLGVFSHGLAGDLAAQSVGFEALVAGDLVSFLAAGWLSMDDAAIL